MSETLFTYKKKLVNNQIVWERVPYEGGAADAVFPGTPAELRNGTRAHNGSVLVSSILEKEKDRKLKLSLTEQLERMGYSSIEVEKKTNESGFPRVYVRVLHKSAGESLELVFLPGEYERWCAHAASISPENFTLSKYNTDIVSKSPLTEMLTRGDKNPEENCFLRKVDVE